MWAGRGGLRAHGRAQPAWHEAQSFWRRAWLRRAGGEGQQRGGVGVRRRGESSHTHTRSSSAVRPPERGHVDLGSTCAEGRGEG